MEHSDISHGDVPSHQTDGTAQHRDGSAPHGKTKRKYVRDETLVGMQEHCVFDEIDIVEPHHGNCKSARLANNNGKPPHTSLLSAHVPAMNQSMIMCKQVEVGMSSQAGTTNES